MHVFFFTLSCCILPLFLIELSLGDQSSAIDSHPMLNYCIDSKNHKSEPGPEDDLHRQVSVLIKVHSRSMMIIVV